MNFKDYALGCYRDIPDDRDYVFAPLKAANTQFPQNFKLHETRVKNQGNINSCVAHSLSTIKEIQEYYETGKNLIFSVGWIYGYRVDNQFKGEGMYPREALNNLVKYGDVLEKDFPENLEYNDIQKLIQRRKVDCLDKGRNYRCKAYAKVTSVNDVKSCLYINHSPVLISCQIYDNFYDTGANGIVGNPKGNDNGGHAMTIVGWRAIGNTEYWIVQNSWGVEFADKGYCYIDKGARFINEVYTVADLENVVMP